VRKAMGHDRVPEDEYVNVWETAVKDFIWLPSKHRYDRNASATNTDRLASIQVQQPLVSLLGLYVVAWPYVRGANALGLVFSHLPYPTLSVWLCSSVVA
jgi:hypothetical protein